MAPLLVERQGGTLTLELARPERGNALADDLVEALLAQLRAARHDASVHTIVLRGQGPHFCTGFDLSDLPTVGEGELLCRVVRIELLLAEVWSAPQRMVAVAHGRTWGAGAELLAACEVRVVRPGTTLRFPGARFGLVLGTRRLATRIGADRTRRLVTEGGEVDAAQALAWGLATHGEPDAERSLPEPVVDTATAAAIRQATRLHEAAALDADLAALVRSAAAPGLRERMLRYVATLRAR
ncbi:MAG: enoyl-CoA hydratase/isomerase family protein [Rubrivivax sp.]